MLLDLGFSLQHLQVLPSHLRPRQTVHPRHTGGRQSTPHPAVKTAGSV